MTADRRVRSSLPFLAALALVATSQVVAQGVESPRVPLRTALRELNTLRTEYAVLYNKKDTAALAALYLPDAAVIRHDGSTVLGQAAIGKALADDAPGWQQITLSSDTLRVFGNTAWDLGSMSSQGPAGEAQVSRYLIVLRRGLQDWKISSAAIVPRSQVTATH